MNPPHPANTRAARTAASLRGTRPSRGERGGGAVSVPVAVVLLALLAVVGLAVDGARKPSGSATADAVAEEAARAGAQAVDLRRPARGSHAWTRPLPRPPPSATSTPPTPPAPPHHHRDGTVAAPDRMRVRGHRSPQPTLLLGVVGMDTLTGARLRRGGPRPDRRGDAVTRPRWRWWGGCCAASPPWPPLPRSWSGRRSCCGGWARRCCPIMSRPGPSCWPRSPAPGRRAAVPRRADPRRVPRLGDAGLLDPRRDRLGRRPAPHRPDTAARVRRQPDPRRHLDRDDPGRGRLPRAGLPRPHVLLGAAGRWRRTGRRASGPSGHAPGTPRTQTVVRPAARPPPLPHGVGHVGARPVGPDVCGGAAGHAVADRGEEPRRP